MVTSDSTHISNMPEGEPRRQWLTPVVGVGIWLTSVAIATGLVSSVVWYVRTPGIVSRADVDGWLWGSREKKIAALRDAFNSRRPVVLDARRIEIETFLTAVTKPSETEDDTRGLRMLDENRFRKRMIRSPWVRSLSLINQHKVTSKRTEEFSIRIPNEFRRIDIIQIAAWDQVSNGHASDHDEIIVFAFGFRETGTGEPMIFWVCKAVDQWKLVDWERVDNGTAATESAGRFELVSLDKLGANYFAANNHLIEINGLDHTKLAEVELHLRQAEACRVPTAVEDTLRYFIMLHWSHRSHYADVKRLAKQISSPDRIPGVSVLLAYAHEALGEREDALAALSHVEELVGFRPELAKMRARLLQQSHRKEDAITEWRRLAEYDPNEVTYLAALQTLLPKSQQSEMSTRIKTAREPAKLALQFATFNSYRMTSEALQELCEFVNGIAPDSVEAREIEIISLNKNNEHRRAAWLYQKAAEQETDPVAKLGHWNGYLRQMEQAGELATAFAQHPDPKAAFQVLFEGVEDGEGTISVDDMPAILETYRTKNPDDPWLLYYEGYVAAEQLRFFEADGKFAEAERLVSQMPATEVDSGEDSKSQPDKDDRERLVYKLRHQRCQTRYQLGEDVKVLENYGREEGVYRALANLAVQYHHWSTLKELNHSFAQASPKDIWLSYNEARALLHARDFEGVRQKIQVIAGFEKAATYSTYLRNELERELLDAEFPNPLDAFAKSKEPSSAFTTISHRLLNNRDWENLEKLCDVEKMNLKEDDFFHVRLDMAWRQSNHAAIVEQLTPWPTQYMAKQSYLESIWRERLVGSLLRLNRQREARELAEDARKRFDELWPLVLTDVASKNVSEISRLVDDEDESLQEMWTQRDFAADPLLRPVLMDETFADLRSQRTFDFPNYGDAESLVLLFDQPIDLNEAWLSERLAKDADSLESKLQITKISESTLVIEWQGFRFVLKAVSEPYFTPEFLSSPWFANRQRESIGKLDTVFKTQRAYWMIKRLYADEPPTWQSPRVTVREFGARLLNSHVVGAVHSPSFSATTHVISLNDQQAELLGSRQSLTELDSPLIISRIPEGTIQLDRTKKAVLLNSLGSQSDPQTPIMVQVQVGQPGIPLTIPFRVHAIRHPAYRGYQVIGEYVGENHASGFPELRPGIRFVIPIEIVTDIIN